MQCFVHIGIDKTAVAHLQDFLSLNSDQLVHEKIIYLNNFFEPKDLLLLASSDAGHEGCNIDKIAVITKFTQYIAAFGDNDFLLSSSDFQSEIKDIPSLEALRESLKSIGFNQIKIIIYLRDQIGLVSALFSSLVRQGACISSIPFPNESTLYCDYFNNLCDHRSTVERFALAFGKENLIVRLFHNSSLKNHSILEDFLDIFQLAWDENFVLPKSDPKALSNFGPELLGRINQRIPANQALARIKLRKSLLASFNHLFTSQAYVLNPDLQQAYVTTFTESNEWVREHFFPERDRLFPQRPLPEPVDLGFTDKELDNIANLLSDIWLERERDLLQQASLNDQKA